MYAEVQCRVYHTPNPQKNLGLRLRKMLRVLSAKIFVHWLLRAVHMWQVDHIHMRCCTTVVVSGAPLSPREQRNHHSRARCKWFVRNCDDNFGSGRIHPYAPPRRATTTDSRSFALLLRFSPLPPAGTPSILAAVAAQLPTREHELGDGGVAESGGNGGGPPARAGGGGAGGRRPGGGGSGGEQPGDGVSPRPHGCLQHGLEGGSEAVQGCVVSHVGLRKFGGRKSRDRGQGGRGRGESPQERGCWLFPCVVGLGNTCRLGSTCRHGSTCRPAGLSSSRTARS